MWRPSVEAQLSRPSEGARERANVEASMIEGDEGNRLAEVRVHSYNLTYAHGTYVMSQSRQISTLPSVVVAVTARNGLTGYAEVCPLGTTYLPGFAGGVVAALEELGPRCWVPT